MSLQASRSAKNLALSNYIKAAKLLPKAYNNERQLVKALEKFNLAWSAYDEAHSSYLLKAAGSNEATDDELTHENDEFDAKNL